MRNILLSCVVVLVWTGCAQKAAEVQGSGEDSTLVVRDSVPATEIIAEPVETETFAMTAANLSKFPYLSASISEVRFLKDGVFKFTDPVDGESTEGTWSLGGSAIVIMIDSDTMLYEVTSFKEEALTLATTVEAGGKLFGEVRRDEYFYIKLYREIFSKPYGAAQVAGGWQVREGGCSFDQSGVFTFGAADCSVEGTWNLDEGYIGVEFTKVECGWQDPFDNNLEIIRLTPGLMITKNNADTFEVFTRSSQ